MEKDDYYVIVYKILAYLYVQLKNGDDIDSKIISFDGKLFNILSSVVNWYISKLKGFEMKSFFN